jgi:hypothetical protein
MHSRKESHLSKSQGKLGVTAQLYQRKYGQGACSSKLVRMVQGSTIAPTGWVALKIIFAKTLLVEKNYASAARRRSVLSFAKII